MVNLKTVPRRSSVMLSEQTPWSQIQRAVKNGNTHTLANAAGVSGLVGILTDQVALEFMDDFVMMRLRLID